MSDFSKRDTNNKTCEYEVLFNVCDIDGSWAEKELDWTNTRLNSKEYQPSNDHIISASKEDIYKHLQNSKPESLLHEKKISLPEEIVEDYPQSGKYLLKGLTTPLPQEYSFPINNRPDWLDLDKFKAGQKFAMDNYLGVSFSQMLSLLLVFSVPGSLGPLIFTDKSSTPFTAYKRYLSTGLRIKSWFENDIWSEGNEGFENIKAVRAMHLNISNKLNKSSREEIKKDLTLESSTRHPNLWCPLSSKWREYFSKIQESRYNKISTLHKEYSKSKNRIYFSQFEMGCTQFAFFGLMVMYPHKFGAGGATRQDLENYVHCWRGIGYLLGVNDEFNFCKGSLDEVLQRCHDFVDETVKLSFRDLSKDWEHMSRCAVAGASAYLPNPCFEVTFAYLCWTIGIDASQYYSSLTWAQYLQFTWLKILFGFVLRIPAVLPILNNLIIRITDAHKCLPSEKLELIKQKTFSYQ